MISAITRHSLRLRLRRLLPLRHTWSGYCREPGGRWVKASCTWWMWLGRVLTQRWRFGEDADLGNQHGKEG